MMKTHSNAVTGTSPLHFLASSQTKLPLSNFHHSIYISGDTLLVPELAEIPKRYSGQNIDLMLVHLGGTTLPSPSVPLLMVTMDAEQGIQLIKLIDPDITIPIHYE